MAERLTREASIGPSTFNGVDNTVSLVWTTGASVRRFSFVDGSYFDEELDVTPGAVRLGRLNAGAPLLNTHDDHDLKNVIGVVVPGSARIAGGRGVATVKLSSAPADADIVAKIRDGIIRNVSVGYVVHRYDVTAPTTTSVAVKRAVDWEPMELSFVAVPADAAATVRSHGGDRGIGVVGAAAARRRMIERMLGAGIEPMRAAREAGTRCLTQAAAGVSSAARSRLWSLAARGVYRG